MATAVIEELVSQHLRAEHHPAQHPGRAMFDEPAIREHVMPLTVEQYHMLIEKGMIAEKWSCSKASSSKKSRNLRFSLFS